MAETTAATPQLEKKAPEVQPVMTHRGLFDEMELAFQNFMRRTHDLFEGRGFKEFGKEFDDMFKPESTTLRPIPIEISENPTELKVKAEIPGFTEKEIEINVEPRRLILRGKSEKTEERKEERGIYNERFFKDFYRAVTLPREIDVTKASAVLRNGIIEITMMKTVTSEPVKIDVKTE